MITLLNNASLAVALKFRGWCLWHYSVEGGLACLQVGPVIFEWYT